MSIQQNGKLSGATESITPKLYKKRWFILLLYMVVSPCGVLQWSQYVVIADVIGEYYNVSYEAVNWTFLITLLVFAICSLPSSYVIDKFGTRMSANISGVGVCIVSWIKVASVSPDKFWLVLLAQALLTITQMPLMNIPPKMAADWFGPDEVSTACSIGVSAIQFGLAIGYLVPPLLINKETVENDLFVGNIGIAILCTVAAVLTFIFFTEKPPVPPSYAAIYQFENFKYVQVIKQLLMNKSFVLVAISGALNMSVIMVLQTVLNQIVLKFYPEASEDVGFIGVLMVIASLSGTVFGGLVIDKFKIFRFPAVIYCLLLILILISFTYTIDLNIVYPYVWCCLFGFFATAYWTAAFQISIETSYPQPESIIIGIAYTIGQSLGIGSTYIYSFLFYEINFLWANVSLIIIYVLSLILFITTKFEFRRLQTNKNVKLEKQPMKKLSIIARF